MSAEIILPVFVRVGDHDEAHFGDMTITVLDGEATLSVVRREMAAFLRAAADEIESPTDANQGVPDAAPR